MQTYNEFLNYTNNNSFYLAKNQLVTSILNNKVPARFYADIVSLDNSLSV
jgi:hypothetical protein